MRIGLELRFLVDHGREQRRIEVVVPRVAANDLLVPQRVPDPLPPRRPRRLEHRERRPDGGREQRSGQQPSHGVSCARTSATNSSSSSSDPSLTYAKSARATFSSSRRSRCTISSLDAVAAPWRANASNASLFPAPMPPVIATATGLGVL